MVTMNRYSITYARALVAATPNEQIVAGRRKSFKGLTDEQIALMERETANLDREFKMIEQSYGVDHLDLVLAIGYVARLLDNLRVVHYLAEHHAETLAELRKIAELQKAARSEEQTSELQSLMPNSFEVFY